ncbi:1778_t:CDS:1, partial [Racocetra fulgida]
MYDSLSEAQSVLHKREGGREDSVKIVIHVKGSTSAPETYFVNDLDQDSTLEDTRKYLSKFEGIFMGHNDVFRNVLSRKIPYSYESSYRVEDILVRESNFYSLHIEKDESNPRVPELVRSLKIDRGYYEDGDHSIATATIPAFSIKDLHTKDIIIQSKFELAYKKTKKNFDQLWIESYEKKHIKEGDKTEENCEEILNEYTIKYCQTGKISLSCNELIPTKEYIDAIDNALKEGNDIQKIENLRQVGNEFGFFG